MLNPVYLAWLANSTRLLKQLEVLVICSLLTGCATFDPATRYQDIMKPRQPTVSEAREGLQMSLEEFVSPEKSRSMFDADLVSHGVFPILLRAENKSEGTYKIEDKEAKALLENQTLPLLSGVDAANQAATREYVSKAAGWTLVTGPFALIFWPVTVSLSGVHTAQVNRKIEQHFETLAFGKAIVKPGQTAAGFLYFKLPEAFTGKEKIIVEIVTSEVQSGKQISFKLPIQNLSLLSKN
jgi:hypothetical protein